MWLIWLWLNDDCECRGGGGGAERGRRSGRRISAGTWGNSGWEDKGGGRVFADDYPPWFCRVRYIHPDSRGVKEGRGHD